MKENSAHYEFSLTNQFFADIDAPEIQKETAGTVGCEENNGHLCLEFPY